MTPSNQSQGQPLVRLRVIGLAVALFAVVPAYAGTIYRCTGTDGKITYTVAPCKASGNAGTEKAIEFPNAPPVVKAPKPVAAPAAKNAPAGKATPADKAEPGANAALAGKKSTPADTGTPAGKRRAAAMRFFYDPEGAPGEHSIEKMEGLIRAALAAWSASCSVDLDYYGTAPYVTPGSPQRVSVRWNEALLQAKHSADEETGVGGTGSMAGGVALRPTPQEQGLLHTITHEIGHVLGLKHNHDDGDSVMSYLPSKGQIQTTQPSASDYKECNRAMEKRFGIDLYLPNEMSVEGMSDKEALQRRRGVK